MWPTKILLGTTLEELRKTILCQNSYSTSRYINLVQNEHEAGLLTAGLFMPGLFLQENIIKKKKNKWMMLVSCQMMIFFSN